MNSRSIRTVPAKGRLVAVVRDDVRNFEVPFSVREITLLGQPAANRPSRNFRRGWRDSRQSVAEASHLPHSASALDQLAAETRT